MHAQIHRGAGLCRGPIQTTTLIGASDRLCQFRAAEVMPLTCDVTLRRRLEMQCKLIHFSVAGGGYNTCTCKL